MLSDLRSGGSVCLSAMAGLFGFVSVASSLVLRVPADYATINEALDKAAEGDTVLVAPGRYISSREIQVDGFSLRSCAFLSGGVHLLAEEGAESTVIDLMQVGGSAVSATVYCVDTEPRVTTIEGFTITGAPTGSSGIFASVVGELSVVRCHFENLDAGAGGGGGIAANGDLRLVDSVFRHCRSDGGGGLYHANGRLEMRGCEFRNCGNAAVFLQGYPVPGSSALVEQCLFLDNFGASCSGLFALWQNLGLEVRDCVFQGNTAQGGALVVGEFGNKLIQGCLFVGNRAEAGIGGAVFLDGNGACEFVSNTLVENSQAFSALGGAAVAILNHTQFHRNLIASSRDASAVLVRSNLGGSINASCNVYWDNAEGNGVELSPTDREVDPGFCSPETGDFTVIENSPCVEPGALGCGQIGAFGVGCGIVSVQPQTWSRIKALHQ